MLFFNIYFLLSHIFPWWGKILGKSDHFLKSWGNENFEFDAEGKEIYPKRILK